MTSPPPHTQILKLSTKILKKKLEFQVIEEAFLSHYFGPLFVSKDRPTLRYTASNISKVSIEAYNFHWSIPMAWNPEIHNSESVNK